MVSDDFDSRLATAFMDYMRKHDVFWKGIHDKNRVNYLANVCAMNRALTVAENIAREREDFPNTRIYTVEEFDSLGDLS